MEDKYYKRVLLLHYYKKGVNAITAAREMCEIEGEKLIDARYAQIWFKQFKNGDFSLKDKDVIPDPC